MALVSIDIDMTDFDAVMKDMDSFKKVIEEKCEVLIRRLAEIGVKVAQARFDEAPYAGDDREVKVYIDDSGAKGTLRIIADGNAALFIEFGTGVLNPEDWNARSELVDSDGVVLHGQYGLHRADSPLGWIYPGEMPENPPALTEPSYLKPGWIHTYGEPPHPAMYMGLREMVDKVESVAKEVFGFD